MRITVSALLFAGVAASALWAQSTAFEVAAVKVNHSEEHPWTYPRLHNGTFSAEGASMKTLLAVAYGLIKQRINGPAWLDTERYDISAKAPEGTADSQVMPLLQSLLKDRFHLESHFEMKELAAYDMVVSKSGAKLKPVDPAHPPNPPAQRGDNVMVGWSTPSQIADALANVVGRPVLNKTGIEGRFGWGVSYAPFSATGNPMDSTAADIFAAVEQQLGLKLEPRKESLQILVIDHLERIPTEN